MNLVSRSFIALTDFSPAVKKGLWRVVYQFLASSYRTKDWTFMNYGFEDPDSLQLALETEADQLNRYFIQLYAHVIQGVDLQGKNVVEVGSGRGGGAEFVNRFAGCLTMKGIDYSAKAVKFCNELYQTDNLSFVTGDAENLPLLDNSVDAVVNVESSHCYGNFKKFLEEVHRVLNPGGHFMYADFRDEPDLASVNTEIQKMGFEIIRNKNISKNVLCALDTYNDEKMKRFESIFGTWLKKPLSEFAGMKGSTMYNALESGETVYYSYVLRKV